VQQKQQHEKKMNEQKLSTNERNEGASLFAVAGVIEMMNENGIGNNENSF